MYKPLLEREMWIAKDNYSSFNSGNSLFYCSINIHCCSVIFQVHYPREPFSFQNVGQVESEEMKKKPAVN
jgi:hypothetical protein